MACQQQTRATLTGRAESVLYGEPQQRPRFGAIELRAVLPAVFTALILKLREVSV